MKKPTPLDERTHDRIRSLINLTLRGTRTRGPALDLKMLSSDMRHHAERVTALRKRYHKAKTASGDVFPDNPGVYGAGYRDAMLGALALFLAATGPEPYAAVDEMLRRAAENFEEAARAYALQAEGGTNDS